MNLVGKIKEQLAEREFLMEGFKIIDLVNPYYIDRKTIYDFMKEKGQEYGGGYCSDNYVWKYITVFFKWNRFIKRYD